jgi:hypothetical protein
VGCIYVNPNLLRRQRQEDLEFKTSQAKLLRTYLKSKMKTKGLGA